MKVVIALCVLAVALPLSAAAFGQILSMGLADWLAQAITEISQLNQGATP